MRRYRVSRVDRTHSECMAVAKQLGASVKDTHAVGGFVDFVMAVRGGPTWLVEVKDGAAIPSARCLTAAERAFAEVWHDKDHHIVVGCAKCVSDFITGSVRSGCCGVDGVKRAIDYDRRDR